MSKILYWGLGIAGCAAAIAAGSAAALRRLSMSSTAAELGLDNAPTDPEVKRRLLRIARVYEPAVQAVIRELFPSVRTTSAYRAPAVNAAVGGVPTSRHADGRAFDEGGIGGIDQTRRAAQHLRANAARLPPGIKTVIAENDHVHVEVWDEGEVIQPIAWLQQNIGATPKFGALA